MGLNVNLEKNFSWLAFPGLIRAIVMLQCVVFFVIFINPETASYFMVTPEGIANGQYWRLISWIFYPFVDPKSYGGLFSAFFMFIILRISFLFSDSLENAWGEIQASLYVYTTIICQALALYLSATGFLPPASLTNQMFYIALFFAFATLFPNVEFLLFFVLPVKVWIFAMISLATIVFSCLSFPPLFLTYGLAFFPYLVWAIPRLYHGRKYRNQLKARRVKFQSQSNDSRGRTLHRCVVCNRTELSNPQLDFRVAENGDEYCLDHLGDDGKPAAP
ncbi:MAG: hypothetical protein P8Q54_02795 [Akkermansiaceae bacterium]|nr:hypothetical protein [Akkermansiaceae bacterium]MDG1362380.1 hypothetical protein [Akkermansiaceae bacterium]